MLLIIQVPTTLREPYCNLPPVSPSHIAMVVFYATVILLLREFITILLIKMYIIENKEDILIDRTFFQWDHALGWSTTATQSLPWGVSRRRPEKAAFFDNLIWTPGCRRSSFLRAKARSKGLCSAIDNVVPSHQASNPLQAATLLEHEFSAITWGIKRT